VIIQEVAKKAKQINRKIQNSTIPNTNDSADINVETNC